MANSKQKYDLKVASLPVDIGGCGQYRVRQYISAFNRNNILKAVLIDAKDDAQKAVEAVEQADILLTRRQHFNGVLTMMENLPAFKIVFDHDDNTFAVSPGSQHYKDLGIEETGIWKNGERGFNTYLNMMGQKELEWQLETSHLNTSPSVELTDLWGEFGKSALVPNALNFEYFPDVEIKANNKGKEIRIGWHGGVSHYPDMAEIQTPINKLLKKNKNWYFYTVGAEFNKFFAHVKDQVRFEGWTAFEAHPFRFKSLDIDVGVIPLADIPFNYYKSEVKFTEYAALKIPALVKDMPPYSHYCKDNVNCLTYKTQEEFEEKLVELVNNEDLKKKLVKNAYEWAREQRNIDKVAVDVAELYMKVKDGI